MTNQALASGDICVVHASCDGTEGDCRDSSGCKPGSGRGLGLGGNLIALSIRENRTVTEYPDTKAEAISLLEDLGVECADDCCPQEHHSGAGYSGAEAVGYYDIWGTTEDGGEWRVHVVFGEV